MATLRTSNPQDPSAAAPSPRLSRNRAFNIFWAGQTFSVLGDAFAIIAVPLLVLAATGSLARMGVVTGIYGGGSLVAGVFAGAIVDRVDRRRLMIACDLGRCVVYSLIPLGWWLLGPRLWLIYLVTAVGAALGMTFGVAYITAVSNLVARDQITDANGRLQTTYALGFVVGPMLAGLVSGRFGPSAAIGVDACSFLASAFSLLFVRLRQPAAVRPAGEPRPGRLPDLLGGLRFLVRHPVLRAVSLLFGGLAFLVAGVTDLFIYMVRHDLGQSDRAVGIVFGIASIGAILGGVLTPAARRRWGFGACFLGGIAVESLALLGAGLLPSLVALSLFAIAYTCGDTARGIVSMSLRQEVTPDHLLGRVTAAVWTLFTVPGPLGAAAVTALGQRIGAPPTLTLLGGCGLVLAALGLLTPARLRRPETIVLANGAAEAPFPRPPKLTADR